MSLYSEWCKENMLNPNKEYYKDYDWSDGMGWQDFHDYMYEEHRDVAIEWWQSNKQN